MRFWDSSALVALHVEQRSTTIMRKLYQRDPGVLAWVLSDVEMRSAIARLAREHAMETNDLHEAITRIETFWKSVHVVALVETVKTRAKRLLAVHTLKAADALQLAAALTAASDDPFGWELVTLDRRLGQAARLEGFTLVP